MKVKSESEVAQSCLILSDPKDCSLPASSVHGIFQARVLELSAINHKDTYVAVILQKCYYSQLKKMHLKIPNGTESYLADKVIFRLLHLASKTAKLI